MGRIVTGYESSSQRKGTFMLIKYLMTAWLLASSLCAGDFTYTGELYIPTPLEKNYAARLFANFTVLDTTMTAIRVNAPVSSVVGDAVYIDASGVAQLSRANSATTARVDGFVEEKITTTNARVVLSGRATVSSLTVGTDYYLSATLFGKITSTAPTAPNFQVFVGRAYNDNGTARLAIKSNGITSPTLNINNLQAAYDNGPSAGTITLDNNGSFSVLDKSSATIFDVDETTGLTSMVSLIATGSGSFGTSLGVGGALTVTGAATALSTLTVSGTLTASGDANVLNDLTVDGDTTLNGRLNTGTAESLTLAPSQTSITVSRLRVAITPDAAGNIVDEILCPTCSPGDVVLLSKQTSDPFTLDGTGGFAADSIGFWEGGDCELDGGQSITLLYRTDTFFWKVLACNPDVSPNGEVNTASNVGSGGQGLFKQKTGMDLEFRNVNAASSKITVALDNPNNEVDIDLGTHASTHNAGGSDALTIDAAAATGSLRTLGTGASQAAAGNDSRLSDDRTASGLRSASTVVSVSAATAPSSGQVLTATSSTVANWQTPGSPTITNDSATQTAGVSTTSATYVVMTGMTLTPVAGTYYCSFSGSGVGSSAGANMQYAIHVAGTVVGHSERDVNFNGGAQTTDYRVVLHTQAVSALNGAQAIDVRYRTDAGTFSVFESSLTCIRLGP